MRLSPLLALPAASFAASVPLQERQSSCKAVHIFLAKGNNEPYPGRQGKLVSAICGGLPSCDYEDIQWNNALEVEYCAALMEGAVNGANQIRDYASRCPDSKLVVSGYSQGGHLVGDILGGGGGTFFQGCVQRPNPGIDRKTSPGNKIAAVLIFGDTRHTANQPYNFESGSGADGLFPRPPDQLAGMAQYTGVARAYCVASDPICAHGDIVANHLNYFDVYTDSAAAWVQEMVGKAVTPTSQPPPPPPTSTQPPPPPPASTSSPAPPPPASTSSSAAPPPAPSSSAASSSTTGQPSPGSSTAGAPPPAVTTPAPTKPTDGTPAPAATTTTTTTKGNAATSLSAQMSWIAVAVAGVFMLSCL